MQKFSFNTSQEAWINFNAMLVQASPKDLLHYSNQVILFDVLIDIAKSWISEDWDFTQTVNYTSSKWTSLKSNYLNMEHTEEVLSLVHHRELKKDKNYNVSMWFSNNHGGGKGCLLNATFSRRYKEDIPILSATMRASEFYKRGMFDLLLLHRLGQEAWGEDATFGVKIFATQLWGGADWLSLLTSVIPPEKLFKDLSHPFTREVKNWYEKFQEVEDPEAMKYHAHRRAVKVIQGKTRTAPLLARHCTF